MNSAKTSEKKTVVTATGKEFKTDYVNASNALGRLTIRLQEVTMAEVAMVFSDPAETAAITYAGQTIENYTKLIYISPEGTSIRVALRKE